MNSWNEINDKTDYFISKFNNLNDKDKNTFMREVTKHRLTRMNQAKTIQKFWKKYWRSISDICEECDKCFDQHREVLCNDDIKHIWFYHQDIGEDEGDLCPDCILKLDYNFGDQCSDNIVSWNY